MMDVDFGIRGDGTGTAFGPSDKNPVLRLSQIAGSHGTTVPTKPLLSVRETESIMMV